MRYNTGDQKSISSKNHFYGTDALQCVSTDIETLFLNFEDLDTFKQKPSGMDLPTWLEMNRQNDDPPSSFRYYWFRTPMGLESIAADEIKERLKADRIFLSHRNVFVALEEGDGEAARSQVLGIRTVDDAYQYAGCCRGLDRSKDSVKQLLEFFQEKIFPFLIQFGAGQYLRITVSFVGKRNFSRFFVENKLNEMAADATPLILLSNENKEPHRAGELRVRCHIEEDAAFIGIGLKDIPLHRRSWRGFRYPGQLHTPVAAGMVRSLKPEKEDAVIDPFCGSGTLLIESALQFPENDRVGYDIDGEAIGVARKSAEAARVTVDFSVQDSLTRHNFQGAYCLISNPPWDEKHQIGEDNRALFLEQLSRWITGSNGAVLLLPDDLLGELRNILPLPLRQVAQTRVRGKLASIVRINNGKKI